MAIIYIGMDGEACSLVIICRKAADFRSVSVCPTEGPKSVLSLTSCCADSRQMRVENSWIWVDWRIILYYVIQVATGMEDKAENQIGVVVGEELYDRCFHPMRCMKKKFQGEWKELHEKLLPGYVFVISNRIQELYKELKRVPAFTKLLGKSNEQFIPLPDHEVEWLERITASSDQSMEVQLSQVSVAEDDVVTILSGPLKDMEGHIKKIDLHKRIAKVEVDFMNRKTVIHLGIEMVGKK